MLGVTSSVIIFENNMENYSTKSVKNERKKTLYNRAIIKIKGTRIGYQPEGRQNDFAILIRKDFSGYMPF